MPNVGTITGSMMLDPSAYISGLNQAAGATRSFQVGVNSISFAGFNRGMIASTTLMYTMGRVMSNMSKGMEEYSNMLGRIGAVADLTAASVSALADSIKSLSVAQGVSRKDIMGGMYTAAQAGYDSPSEMRAMGRSGALLSRASGKEIDVKKSVDLLAGLRQGLGIGHGALTSNRTTDLLLRTRDIGRWELDQMAEAIGKVSTVYGNQFGSTLGGEETLRQIAAIMSVASLTGLPTGMVSTGTRRLAERTFQLNGSKRGDPLRQALRGLGYHGKDAIMQAFNKGPMSYLQDLTALTGGTSEGLYKMGYQSRELSAVTSALRGKGTQLQNAYQELSPANVAGTTDRYNEKMRQTYDYSRDRLRAQWEITSQEFMQAAVPLIGQFTSVLGKLNDVAQALPASVKSFMLLLGAMAAFRLSMNLLGFRTHTAAGVAGMGAGGLGGSIGGMTKAAAGAAGAAQFARLSPEEAQAARQARRLANASGRSASYRAGFGGPSTAWASNIGAPWATSYTPFKPMMWNEISQLGRDPVRGFGPRWYNAPRGEPTNFVQEWAMRATNEKYDRLRAESNGAYWASDGSRKPYMRTQQLPPAQMRQQYLMNTAALGEHFLPGQITGRQYSSNGYGPSAEARIRWAAHQRGQSVDFRNSSYGSMSAGANAYQSRGVPQGSLSVKEMAAAKVAANARGSAYVGLGSAYAGTTAPIIANMGRQAANPLNANSVAVGTATAGMISFGKAIWNVLGPFAKFAALLGVAGAFLEGHNYRGRGGPDDKVGGLGTWKPSKGGPGILEAAAHTVKSAGALTSDAPGAFGDLQDEYAAKHGYVANENGGEIRKNLLKKLGAYAVAANPASMGVGVNLLSGLAKKNPFGLEGFRRGTMNDAMGDLSRENLSPGQVQRLRHGGIDFDKFSSAQKYVERFMKEQLNMNAPGNWDEWMRGDSKGNKQIVEDALKFYADEMGPAKGAKPVGQIRTSKDGTQYTRNNGFYDLVKKAPPKVSSARNTIPAPDWAAVGQQVSPEMRDQLVRSSMLSGRQWDIYQGADYSGNGKNGNLNWGAGGRDYRAMYNAELANMDTRFGGFSDRSTSGEIRTALTLKGGGGLRALMGKKGQFKEDSPFGVMLDQGDANFASMQKIREFLKVMPDLGTMAEGDQKALFTKMTGREVGGDAFSKANFDNFRNMNIADYVSVDQTSKPVQYASATQFGTAEAYNELLARPKPDEKMTIAADKLINYFDKLTTKEEDVNSELAKLTKAATRFLEQEGADAFFQNVQDIATTVGD